MSSKAKIVVKRVRESDGIRYQIADWALYSEYLKDRGLTVPARPYGVFVGTGTSEDYAAFAGPFEKQLPGLFQVEADRFVLED